MAETLVSLKALERGLEVGTIGFKKARELFLDTWSRAFGEYDIEKVFWQSTYGIGIYFLAKTIYQMWIGAQLSIKYPELIPEEYFRILPWQILASPLVWLLVKALVPEEEVEAKRQLLLKELGIPEIIDSVLGEWSFPIMLGIPAFFGFLEYRRVKKLRELINEALNV